MTEKYTLCRALLWELGRVEKELNTNRNLIFLNLCNDSKKGEESLQKSIAEICRLDEL
jgi:hypothetical protein